MEIYKKILQVPSGMKCLEEKLKNLLKTPKNVTKKHKQTKKRKSFKKRKSLKKRKKSKKY